jgi:hypothetical protein
MVNPEGPLIDPVYGYHVRRLEADHIVSVKSITEMPYFDKIGQGYQLEVLNMQENFMGLGKSTNTSMGAKSWSEWDDHSRLGPVPSDFRADMIQREAALRRILQSKINHGLRNGQ